MKSCSDAMLPLMIWPCFPEYRNRTIRGQICVGNPHLSRCFLACSRKRSSNIMHLLELNNPGSALFPLSPPDQKDDQHPGRHCPAQVDPGEGVVLCPGRVEGAEAGKQYRPPEERRFGAGWRVPEPFDSREVRNQRDALDQHIGEERLVGDGPEHHNASTCSEAPPLGPVKRYGEGAKADVGGNHPEEDD